MLASASSTSGGGNFLVPNGTIIVELVIFIVVLGIVAKFILPPITKVMDDRQRTIRDALSQSDEGQAEAARLFAERREILEQARSEARSIIDDANAQTSAMLEDARARGTAEQQRLLGQARDQLTSERDRVRSESLERLDRLVVQAASQVIGAEIDPAKHRQLIDELATSGGAQ